jgi:hypothetical protein
MQRLQQQQQQLYIRAWAGKAGCPCFPRQLLKRMHGIHCYTVSGVRAANRVAIVLLYSVFELQQHDIAAVPTFNRHKGWPTMAQQSAKVLHTTYVLLCVW